VRHARDDEIRELVDEDYDPNGWPLATIRLSFHTYSLLYGPCSCWLAEFEHLPGYYGEGATPYQALDRLKQSLGSPPHYKVSHLFRGKEKLRADVSRHHRAMAAAAETRAAAFGINLGGGAGVDAAAKEKGVGKQAVNKARAEIAEAIRSPDGRLIAGVSRDALHKLAEASVDAEETNLLVAEQAPWRLEHAAARRKFPFRNG